MVSRSSEKKKTHTLLRHGIISLHSIFGNLGTIPLYSTLGLSNLSCITEHSFGQKYVECLYIAISIGYRDDTSSHPSVGIFYQKKTTKKSKKQLLTNLLDIAEVSILCAHKIDIRTHDDSSVFMLIPPYRDHKFLPYRRQKKSSFEGQ